MKTMFTKFFNRVMVFCIRLTGKWWWEVSCDVGPFDESGQCEMDSCVVVAHDMQEALELARNKIAKRWRVDADLIYVFDVCKTKNPI